MINRIKRLLQAREKDDRHELLRVVRILAGGGDSGEKLLSPAKIEALLTRTDRSAGDLEHLVSIEQQRLAAEQAAADLPALQASASEAMFALKSARARRDAEVSAANAVLERAQQEQIAAQRRLQAADAAQQQRDELESQLLLGLGVDPEMVRRAATLPAAARAMAKGEATLRHRLDVARREVEALEREADGVHAGPGVLGALERARAEVERLESELTALPDKVARMQHEAAEMREGWKL